MKNPRKEYQHYRLTVDKDRWLVWKFEASIRDLSLRKFIIRSVEAAIAKGMDDEPRDASAS